MLKYTTPPKGSSETKRAPFAVRRIMIRYRVSISHASTIAHLLQLGGA